MFAAGLCFGFKGVPEMSWNIVSFSICSDSLFFDNTNKKD